MKISAATLAILLSSTAAYAADLAPQPVEPIAPVAAPYSWTGFYGGVQAGYTWGKSDYSDYWIASGEWDYKGKLTANGFTAGVYTGYNYQFQNNLVVGIEGDINYDSLKGSARARGNLNFSHGAPDPITTYKQRAELKWDGSVRLRVGYALDRFLPYVTGGVAFGKYDFAPIWNVDGPLRYSSTQVGWTVGAGLEYAVTDNLIARVEYRYADYGKKDYFNYSTTAAGNYNDRINLKTHTIRAGISYKF
ncbi:outer membrane protein [Labrys portucalensis]|uniref:Outer membrane protein n=1 Tax=Labrys neptuniae TaxID=376174 RepID=A0ABV6Z7W1_9HYPH